MVRSVPAVCSCFSKPMAVKRSAVNYGLLICCMMARVCVDSQVMHLSVSSRRGKGIGKGFDRSLCLAVPGVRIFEFFFMHVTTNHFPGWGISLIFDLTFCLGVGNFTAIFWKMSNSCPMPCLLLHWLDIDRCIV